jgi:tetratricopeptide (TPR) repeat protein
MGNRFRALCNLGLLCTLAAFGQPDELQTRTQAIRSYTSRTGPAFTEQVKLARRADILWVIEQHPEASILEDPSATIYPSGQLFPDAEGFEQARALWRKVTASEQTPAKVLGNAAAFFISTDPPLAIEMLQRARKSEPKNPAWALRLGQVYAFSIAGIGGVNRNGLPSGASRFDMAAARAQVEKLIATGDAELMGTTAGALNMQGRMALSMSGHAEAVRALAEPLFLKAQELQPRDPKWHYGLAGVYKYEAGGAEKQFAEFARAQQLQPQPLSGPLALDYMTAAVETGHLDAAAQAAQVCLDEGSDRHHCNIVLGRVALRRGDLDRAAQYLIAAAQPPGGPTMSSFGPNMSLARELLEKGRREPVLRYFALCEPLWTLHPEKLKQWTEEVKAGKIPEFGANLVY